MDSSAAGPLIANPGPGSGSVALGVPSGPGWLALRDCPLGGGGPPVGLALLHPKIGVALVDFVPVGPDAADRFRRALEARRFPAIFAGYPPVVRAVLPEDRLPDLGHVLAAKFKEQPPLALEGGDAWVPSARAALEAKPESAASGHGQPDAARRRDVSPKRAATYLLAAAAAGAALAAVLVAAPPPRRGPEDRANGATAPLAAPAPEQRTAGPPPDAAAAFLPEPPANPAAGASSAPARTAADPASDAGTPREAVARQTGDGWALSDGGSDAAAAAAPRAAEGGPAPATSATEDQPGTAPLPDSVPPDFMPPVPATALADRPGPAPPVAAGRDSAAARAGGAPPLPARAAGAPSRAAPAAAPLPAETPGGKRCRDILVKTTLGGSLSDADKEHMRRGCHRARD